MGGKHIVRFTFNTASIALIFFKSVKVNQVSARPIHEETEKLLEDLGNFLTLATLSYLTKNLLQIWEQFNTSQISNKKSQSSPAGKNIPGYFYVVNNWLAFTVICATIFHNKLPPVGFCLWLIVVWRLLHLYHKLTLPGGFFLYENRSC